MTMRNGCFLVVAFFVLLPGRLLSADSPAIAGQTLLPSEIPGSRLPIQQEHSYRMSGRIRVLLLWIDRDDVGSGVIRWRGNAIQTGPGGAGRGMDVAYELLIGSDPLRAPGQLNRWGYLAEEVRDGECVVVGVMSKDSEQRLGDVRTDLALTQAGRPFDTIRSRVTQNRTYTHVSTLQAASSLTYREWDAVLKLVLGEGAEQIRQIDRPDGARPGFLSSVAEIIQLSLESEAKGKRLSRQTVPFVYGDGVYELQLLDATPAAHFERDGRVFERVISARFETRRAGNTSGSRFELVYGTVGHLAGVPILISYHPKWWLQVELLHES